MVEHDLVAAEDTYTNDELSTKCGYLGNRGFHIRQSDNAPEYVQLNHSSVWKDKSLGILGLQSLYLGLWNHDFSVEPSIQNGIFLKDPTT